jgi:hypothetical protein
MFVLVRKCQCSDAECRDVLKGVECRGMGDESIHNDVCGFQASCCQDSSNEGAGGSVDDPGDGGVDVVSSAKSATSRARRNWESHLC